MKTKLAVLLGLAGSVSVLSSYAAVLPASAAFGASINNIGGNPNDDFMAVGYPANVNATAATPFNDSGGTEDTQDNPTVTIGTTYKFRLTYSPSAGPGTDDLVFEHLNAGGTVLDAVDENDVYASLAALGSPFSGLAANIHNLQGLVFGFTAPAGYSISLTGLTLNNAAWSSGIASTNLSFSGPGVSDYVTGGYYLPATGLSDGFILNGSFLFSGTGGDGTSSKMGFEVYAVVPEPATVAFGLALVGGLGLVEVRRRKKA